MVDNKLIEKCKENFYGYTYLEIATQIVCIGIGAFFDTYLKTLHEMGISWKISALIDNNEEKQGLKKKIGNRELVIRDFDFLKDMTRDNREFIILITTKHYEDIIQQLKQFCISDSINVFTAAELQDVRVQRVATYSNLFRHMDRGIGKYGERMTISVLAHDRAELTIRLIDSICEKIPDFQGKILIGDNKSESEELIRVRNRMKKCHLDWEILEFDRHYPIPAGKNMVNRKVRTDWIMQLDNDIYFIDDPLEKINSDIKELGCSIWGLPCLDTKYNRVVNYGSNLDLVQENEGIKIRCCVDLPYYQTEKYWSPMLCTYAAGGVSLFRKELKKTIGEYDENLYMFEDIDFMYRTNEKGYKIGNIGMLSFVHDHKSIDSESGINYEKIRFDMERMQKSNAYFKKKHGFGIK